jgi:signal peptidase I
MSPWTLLAIVPVAVVALAIAAVRRRFVVVRVSGTSMAPGLLPGDRVLVRRGCGGRIGAGTVVVLPLPALAEPGRPPDTGLSRRRPRTEWMIKRVAAAPGDTVPESVHRAVGGVTVVPPGMLVVLGDSTRSVDSRLWGFLPAERVLGAAVRRLPGKGPQGTAGQRRPASGGPDSRRETIRADQRTGTDRGHRR